VTARVVDAVSPIGDIAPELAEKIALGRALEEIEGPLARERMQSGREPSDPGSEGGDTRAIVAPAVGMSPQSGRCLTVATATVRQALGPRSFARAPEVSRRRETSRRREVLSWSHHREVAALDPPEQGEDEAES